MASRRMITGREGQKLLADQKRDQPVKQRVAEMIARRVGGGRLERGGLLEPIFDAFQPRGQLLAVNPQKPASPAMFSVPDDVRHTPIFAQQQMWLADAQATLHRLH